MSRSRLAAMVAWLALGALAAVVYRPDRPLPFDVWDFREFLPILQARQGLLDRYVGLLGYYTSHGRMNPLFYFTFALQYQAFGENAYLWQLARFALMWVDVGLVMVLARRLGMGATGAALAGGLLVVATPAVRGWVQLMAEPMALAALLVAALAAVEYQVVERYGWRAAVIALCVLAALLSKEVVGGLGAAVVLFAVTGWSRPPGAGARWFSRRNLVLASATLLAAVAVGAMILVIRSGDQATGYGMAYGSAPLSAGRYVGNVVASTEVVHPEGRAAMGLLYPANLLVLLMVLLGLAAAVRRGVARRRLALAVGLGMLPPVLGALLYLPWPKFDAFYGLPLFVGPALLMGAACDALVRSRGARRWLAVVASVLTLGYAAIPASRSTEIAAAALVLNEQIARTLAALPPGDTVLVMGPTAGPRVLTVRADELRDYAVARRFADPAELPTVVDTPCERYFEVGLLDRPSMAALTYSYGCGTFPTSDVEFTAPFAWRDWISLERMVDSLKADLSGAAVRRAGLQTPP
ncbi:MAG TPA: hypothetical protein VJ997_10860 [Longimicrobiales bacterium]|nr:hypothetical protein [Longimicrobiales bacterium]